MAQWVAECYWLSQRRMCCVITLGRSTLQYRSRRQDEVVLRTRIREIAESKRRYGCPRIFVRLCREGWAVNHKKIERIHYHNEGLSFRRRRRKMSAAVSRGALPRPSWPGLRYAIDFAHDRLVTGRRFKCLTMTDSCSKEVPVIEVYVLIGGVRVCWVLDRLFTTRPLPETLDPGQRSRILRNGRGYLGSPTWHAPALYSTEKIPPECVCRKLQRQVLR